MMQRHMFNDKIESLLKEKRAACEPQQKEIDLFISGMTRAIGDDTDDEQHEKRMELFYSSDQNEKQKGIAYRKGMDAVLYGVPGKKKEQGTVRLAVLAVSPEIHRALCNIKDFLGVSTLSPVRKAALRWYVEMMNEKHGKDFYK